MSPVPAPSYPPSPFPYSEPDPYPVDMPAPPYGPGQPYGQAPPSGQTQPYAPAPPYDQAPPYGQAPPYDQAPPYGPETGYPPPGLHHDTTVTHVFGLADLQGGDRYSEGHWANPGLAPVLADEFADSPTTPIHLGELSERPGRHGAHAGFGPPPAAQPRPEPEPGAHLFGRLRRIRSHAKQPRRSRGWISLLLGVALVSGVAGLRYWPASPWYYGGEPDEAPASVPMPFHDAAFTAADLGTDGFLSWAYQDLRDGTVVGSENMAETTDATSMIVTWIGADFLRRAAEAGEEPVETDLADVEAMIRDDDLAAADRIVARLDGIDDSIGRLRQMCSLEDVEPRGEPWPDTDISARDAARLGGCLADGRAAGAQWTPWLLNVMRQVRVGDFGIRKAFPTDEQPMIAIKNGVALNESDGQWRANCLAVSETWALVVLQRYPSSSDATLDRAHVDAVCQQVVQRLTGAS